MKHRLPAALLSLVLAGVSAAETNLQDLIEDPLLPFECTIGKQAVMSLSPQGTALPYDQVRGEVSYASRKRSVRVTWSRRVTNESTAKRVTEKASFATRYHPTAVEQLSATKLAVAGITPDLKRVVVEVWAFERPQLSASTSSSGAPPYGLTGSSRVTVDEVYNEPVGSAGAIEHLMRNLNAPFARCLAQFSGDRCVYDVPFDGTAKSTVCSPAGVSGAVPPLAELNRVWKAAASFDHPTLGYQYVFYHQPDRFGIRSDPSADPDFSYWLVLSDSNRDGTVESSHSVTPSLALQLGL